MAVWCLYKSFYRSILNLEINLTHEVYPAAHPALLPSDQRNKCRAERKECRDTCDDAWPRWRVKVERARQPAQSCKPLGRFVENQDVGVMHQGARQQHPLELPALCCTTVTTTLRPVSGSRRLVRCIWAMAAAPTLRVSRRCAKR